jgi:hypothetical protein
MRSRISLVGAAIAAGSLVIGVGFAGAASKHTAAKAVTPTAVKCKIMTLTTTPPADSNVVLIGDAGTQYGRSFCAKSGFGAGIIADSFTVPDSGDTVGTYTEYFRAGTVFGKFDLTPLEGTGISDTGFGTQSWTGTITVRGGTGVYQGIARAQGKKGIGTMNCTSPDSVHLSCTETVKVLLPANFKP